MSSLWLAIILVVQSAGAFAEQRLKWLAGPQPYPTEARDVMVSPGFAFGNYTAAVWKPAKINPNMPVVLSCPGLGGDRYAQVEGLAASLASIFSNALIGPRVRQVRHRCECTALRKAGGRCGHHRRHAMHWPPSRHPGARQKLFAVLLAALPGRATLIVECYLCQRAAPRST